MPKELSYSAVFVRDEDGGFTAFVPALPGCHSQGETLRETRFNIIEAAEVYLESLAADREPIPREEGVSQQKISVANPALIPGS